MKYVPPHCDYLDLNMFSQTIRLASITSFHTTYSQIIFFVEDRKIEIPFKSSDMGHIVKRALKWPDRDYNVVIRILKICFGKYVNLDEHPNLKEDVKDFVEQNLFFIAGELDRLKELKEKLNAPISGNQNLSNLDSSIEEVDFYLDLFSRSFNLYASWKK